MFSSATQPPPPRGMPPPRHNFVSAITFESLKARNTIKNKFRTSKMADQSELARNAIQSDFQTSKMAAGKKNCI